MEIATRCGFVAEGLSMACDLQQVLHSRTVDLLLMDLTITRESLQLLEEIKALKPDTPIILMSAAATIPSAVEAMRRGVIDILVKPFSVEQLEAALDQSIVLKRSDRPTNPLVRSQQMDTLYRLLANVAQSRHPVLIVGESGTGKETVARMLHAQSEFALQPFLMVDCNANTDQIERELFGYVQSALPVALQSARGVLVSAERSTLFLDEVGQLPLFLQSKLLKALQERERQSAGMTHSIRVHARVLAASSADLAAAVTKGLFRKDLYERLNVVMLRVPPLRERLLEIPLLTTQILDRIWRETGQRYTLGAETLHSMMNYNWPNNIRELENTIERACTMATGSVIRIGDLPTQQQKRELALRRGTMSSRQSAQTVVQFATPFQVMPLADLEKQAIISAITRLNGDKLLAAHMLGIGKTTLYRKLKAYGIAQALAVQP
jgi:two-component system response regulator HydG